METIEVKSVKNWWESKTVWASILIGLFGVLSMLGYPIKPELIQIIGAFGLFSLRTAKTNLR